MEEPIFLGKEGASCPTQSLSAVPGPVPKWPTRINSLADSPCSGSGWASDGSYIRKMERKSCSTSYQMGDRWCPCTLGLSWYSNFQLTSLSLWQRIGFVYVEGKGYGLQLYLIMSSIRRHGKDEIELLFQHPQASVIVILIDSYCNNEIGLFPDSQFSYS